MSYFRNIKLSQSDRAVRIREQMLTNDEAANRHADQVKRHRDRSRMKKLRGVAESKARTQGKPRGRFSDGFLARVRHHLSRGRTPADIVVRENVLMSVVEAAVAQVRKEVA